FVSTSMPSGDFSSADVCQCASLIQLLGGLRCLRGQSISAKYLFNFALLLHFRVGKISATWARALASDIALAAHPALAKRCWALVSPA
ncbi:MAG: hypothetical protein WCB53_02785, partial [Terriglobales bacterium]